MFVLHNSMFSLIYTTRLQYARMILKSLLDDPTGLPSSDVKFGPIAWRVYI